MTTKELGVCDVCGKRTLVAPFTQDKDGAWLRCCEECFDGMSEPASNEITTE